MENTKTIITEDNAREYLEEVRHCFAYCASLTPVLGALAFYIKRRVLKSSSETKGRIAAASHDTIYYYPEYFDYSKMEQVFINLHEVSHVVLQHTQRAKKLGLQGGDPVFNIAADIVINHALEQLLTDLRNENSGLCYAIPKEALNFKTFLPSMNSGIFSKMSVEEVYRMLVDQLDKEGGESKGSSAGRVASISEKAGNGTDDLLTEEQAAQLNGSTAAKDTGDLKDSEDSAGYEKPESVDADASIAEWQERIEQASSFGPTGSPNIFTKLTSDLPEVETDWRKATRSMLSKSIHSSRGKSATYNKPSRRYLSGAVPYFEPGKRNKASANTVAVMFDLSGSCYSKSVIEEFAANVSKVQELLKCSLSIVMFDTEVTKILHNVNLKDEFDSIEWVGGGGTDFSYLFDKVLTDSEGNKLKAKDVNTYLVVTDLQGTMPVKAPRVPTMWAGMKADLGFADRVPFGSYVLMK